MIRKLIGLCELVKAKNGSSERKGRLICYVDASCWSPRFGFTVHLEGHRIAQEEGSIALQGLSPTYLEYQALIRCLEYLSQQGWRDRPVTVHSDCQHMVRQLNGEMPVRNPALRPLYNHALTLLSGFEDIQLEWVPRSQNGEAHRVASKRTTIIVVPGVTE